jgi:hypothetical protein
MEDKHIFERRHYNAMADIIQSILLSTKPEHLEVAGSLFLRFANGLALKSSNIQIGRFMDAAGIPSSASVKDTRRS